VGMVKRGDPDDTAPESWPGSRDLRRAVDTWMSVPHEPAQADGPRSGSTLALGELRVPQCPKIATDRARSW
jgi:hypothetical protein